MNSERIFPSPSEFVIGCRAIFKQGEYVIVPQENRCSNPDFNLKSTDVQICITPKQGAGYLMSEYLIQPGGGTINPISDSLETFLFLINGKIELKLDQQVYEMIDGGYAWIPPQQSYEFISKSEGKCRLLCFQRPYISLEGFAPPEAIISNENAIPAIPEVDINPEKQLMPYANPGIDMAFNLIVIPPGGYYGLVEQHAWEHAMYMLDGEGFLFLNGQSHSVKQNDFIYIAPYIPEWFCAAGFQARPVRFLLYWDCNRDYAQSLRTGSF